MKKVNKWFRTRFSCSLQQYQIPFHFCQIQWRKFYFKIWICWFSHVFTIELTLWRNWFVMWNFKLLSFKNSPTTFFMNIFFLLLQCILRFVMYLFFLREQVEVGCNIFQGNFQILRGHAYRAINGPCHSTILGNASIFAKSTHVYWSNWSIPGSPIASIK